MKTDWQGYYLDGQTAARHPAAIRLTGQGLEITTHGGWTRFWPYREIRQTQGFYEGEEVRLERGGDFPEVLLVSDLGFLLSLHEMAPELSRGFHHPGRRSRRARLTIVAAVAVVAVTVGLYLWGIPALASVAAGWVPVSWEESLGRSAAEHLAPPEWRCEDPRVRAALDAIVARLTATAPRSPYTFRVYVVRHRMVNAFAAPGGYVVVFSGLLERTRTPEELAGVLAHEFQHVLHHHATKAIIQHASTGLLLAALTGDVTGPLAYGLEAARTLAQLSYSRAAEEEADTAGMKMVLAARLDPAGMVAFFESMTAEERGAPEALRYLSTHPMSRERAARLTAMAATASGPFEKLLPGDDWTELRGRCRAPGRGSSEER